MPHMLKVNTQDIKAKYTKASHHSEPLVEVEKQTWLHRKQIHTTLVSSKLENKKLRKYNIVESVRTHADLLELPGIMKVHPGFHVSLLEPVQANPLPGKVQPLPLPSSKMVMGMESR